MNSNHAMERISLLTPAAWWLAGSGSRGNRLRQRVAGLRSRLDVPVLGRVKDCFCCICLWVALPLAVFTCNGLLGLLVHWVALAGAASLFEKTGPEPAREGRGMEVPEGETTCAGGRMESI